MASQHHDQRDGISIEDRHTRGRSGKRWLARVRDTRLRRYKSKAFADLDAAKTWARHMRARFELSEASAGTWPIDEVLAGCVENMRREGKVPTYIHAMERHGKQLYQVGLRDLNDAGLHAKVRRFLNLPTDMIHRRKADKSDATPAVSTMVIRFGYVRVLVSYAIRHMGLRQDPLMGFISPKVTHKRQITKTSDQETYTLDEIRAVLALDRKDDPAWLAFAIAIFSGLRAFELRALRWEEMDWSTRTIRVSCGKGGKIRHVPMQPELHDLLWTLGGPGAKRPRIGPLFSIADTRFCIKQIRPLLDLADVKWDRGVNDRTGLPRRLAWHACRRTCAAASLAAGVDSLEIQRALGHEEMEMTGEYAGAFTRWKSVIVAEGWPRGRLCLFGPPSDEKTQSSVPK